MLRVIRTQDGSPTIHHSVFNATYHSVYGAVQESNYVFIQHGLKPLLNKEKDRIKILEIGFGTGLNALLTYIEWKNFSNPSSKNIAYIGIEKYLLEKEMLIELHQYPPFKDYHHLFEKLHHSKDIYHKIEDNFELKILNIDILHALHSINENDIDVIYYDAFAPSVQPELWKKEILEYLYQKMTHDGILVSYCAQGQFKRNLKEIGFKVESLKGAPGKREMTRAMKKKKYDGTTTKIF